MTERTVKRVTDGAAHRSPVADVPEGLTADQFAGSRGRVPGRLKRSWKSGAVEETTSPSGEARFGGDSYTEDPVAPHVEWDTRPHIIRPRVDRAPASVVSSGKPRLPGTDPRARLRFWQGGREVFAGEVRHPGTQGQHMMRDSLASAEVEWADTIGAEEIERWAREQSELVH